LISGSPRTFTGFLTQGQQAVAWPLRLDVQHGARALDLPALSPLQRSTLDALLPR